MEFSETNSRGDVSLAVIHGFRVQSYGKRVSPGFKRALMRLAEKDFDDQTCVVVKTTSGSQSGITHAGGRYVDPDNPYRTEVMRQMRELGMEPPPTPFIIAPGEYTLYHEWGHHVDHTWSGHDREVSFSFRWFSHFYELCTRQTSLVNKTDEFSPAEDDIRQIDSDQQAANAIVPWWHVSSELFANLFEDWMRGKKKIPWDQCEPRNLNASAVYRGHHSVRFAFLPGMDADRVRSETYALFAGGIQSAIELPSVRPDLLGANTDGTIQRWRKVLEGARLGQA